MFILSYLMGLKLFKLDSLDSGRFSPFKLASVSSKSRRKISLPKDWCMLVRTKRSSILLLCLVRINVHQSLFFKYCADLISSVTPKIFASEMKIFQALNGWNEKGTGHSCSKFLTGMQTGNRNKGDTKTGSFQAYHLIWLNHQLPNYPRSPSKIDT